MAASSERSHPSRHSLRSFLRMRSEDAPLRWSRACPARTGGGWCASKSSLIVGPIYSRKGAAGQEVSAFMERSRVGGVSNHGRKLGAKPSFETLAALVPQDEVRGCAPGGRERALHEPAAGGAHRSPPLSLDRFTHGKAQRDKRSPPLWRGAA